MTSNGIAVFGFLVPQTKADLSQFYACVIGVCLVVNIIWDIFTSCTPRFSLERLREKVGVLFGSTTIASSLLLVISVFNDQTLKLIGDTTLPLLVAGLAGLLISLPELSPVPGYQRTKLRDQSHQGG